MKIKLLVLLLLILPIFCNAQVTHTIPFVKEGSHIFLKVDLKGIGPQKYLFDTGAARNIISREIADKLGLELNEPFDMHSFGGSQKTYHTTLPEIKMNDLVLANQPTLVMENVASPGQDFVGVIGSRFLLDYIVEIDYENSCFIIYDREKFKYSGKGFEMRINFYNFLPCVETTINYNGKQAKGFMVIDTGADAYSLLLPNAEEEFKISESFEKSVLEEVNSPSGSFNNITGRVESLCFGDYCIDNVPLKTICASDDYGLNNPNYIGMIGDKLLSRFNLYFDFKSRKVIFEPNRNKNNPMLFNLLGCKIGLSNKGGQITHIDKGGAASDCGLRLKDYIFKINQLNVSEYSSSQLLALFDKEGGVLNLLVNRDNKELEIKLKLKDIL